MSTRPILLKMLHPLYQKHLGNQITPSELLFLDLLIEVLQDLKQVKLEILATALPLPILFESRRKKLQRFLSLSTLDLKSFWFPIIQDWLSETLATSETLYIAIDRTNWDDLNLMMVSLIYQGRALPLSFELLPKLGASNLAEQQRVLFPILALLKSHKIVILGDREFCSVQLANWLREENVSFCSRLKENTSIEKDGKFERLNQQGLKPGISFFFKTVRVTQQNRIKGFNVAAKWKRSTRQAAVKEGWYILTNLEDKKAAIAAYKKRFDIEEMFRDFKGGGYNLEETKVRGKRLESLIVIVCMAYFKATLIGQKLHKKGVGKYIGRSKEVRRITRRHSHFYLGLYCSAWVPFVNQCWETVEKLMDKNRNKLPDYLRGMRAMTLILSAL